jgi:hypothetical protein
MELTMGQGQALGIDVGIDFRGGDVGMAQQFLDHAQVGTMAEQVGGKRVPQQVGIDILLDPGPMHGLLDDSPEARGGQFATVFSQDDLPPGFGGHQFRSPGD